MGDKAVRVVVGLRLRLNICEPHACPYDAHVDARSLHGLSCKRSTARSTCHQQLNYLIWRALKRANIPSIKVPHGLPFAPWQEGICLAWDVTVVDTLASSYVSVSATRDGRAAEAAAERKSLKYALIINTHISCQWRSKQLGPSAQAACCSWRGLAIVLPLSQATQETFLLYFKGSQC